MVFDLRVCCLNEPHRFVSEPSSERSENLGEIESPTPLPDPHFLRNSSPGSLSQISPPELLREASSPKSPPAVSWFSPRSSLDTKDVPFFYPESEVCLSQSATKRALEIEPETFETRTDPLWTPLKKARAFQDSESPLKWSTSFETPEMNREKAGRMQDSRGNMSPSSSKCIMDESPYDMLCIREIDDMHLPLLERPPCTGKPGRCRTNVLSPVLSAIEEVTSQPGPVFIAGQLSAQESSLPVIDGCDIGEDDANEFDDDDFADCDFSYPGASIDRTDEACNLSSSMSGEAVVLDSCYRGADQPQISVLFEGMVSSEAPGPSMGFSTARGKALAVSPSSLRQARALLEQDSCSLSAKSRAGSQKASADEDLVQTVESGAMFEGFKTASGKQCSIDPKSLTRARAIMGPEIESEHKVAAFEGFSSAKGRRIQVSDASLVRARAMFSESSENEGISDRNDASDSTVSGPLMSAFSGFKSANGLPLSIQNETVERMKALFEGDTSGRSGSRSIAEVRPPPSPTVGSTIWSLQVPGKNRARNSPFRPPMPRYDANKTTAVVKPVSVPVKSKASLFDLRGWFRLLN